MVYNAANRKDVRRAEKAARQADVARQDTVRGLMSTTQGRQWAYERLVACHIFASSFSLDALQMAFAEGERNAGLQLLNDVMQVSPDEYIQMMREANVRDTIERTRGPDPDGGDQGPDPATGTEADSSADAA
jgi:hypothetical protein